MLSVAIDSILKQTYRAIEIVIGDDSPDDETEALVASLTASSSIPIIYKHNRPGLGQNANVNALLNAANGEYIVLLHDDDVLIGHAIETMIQPMLEDQSLQLVFGKQEVIDQNGAPKPKDTLRFNERCFRTAERAGRQRSAIDSALRDQIPNDGFLIRSKLAKEIGYRSAAEVGVFCDLDFSIRLAQVVLPGSLLYIDEVFSLYRETGDAISRSARSHLIDHPYAGMRMYQQVLSLPEDPETSEARRIQLIRQSDKALKGFAFSGKRIEALKVFFSPYYPIERRLSAKGAYHLSLLIFPQLERMRRANEV